MKLERLYFQVNDSFHTATWWIDIKTNSDGSVVLSRGYQEHTYNEYKYKHKHKPYLKRLAEFQKLLQKDRDLYRRVGFQGVTCVNVEVKEWD